MSSAMPHELLMLLLETTASQIPSTHTDSQTRTKTLLALAATTPALYAIYKRIELDLLRRAIEAQIGGCTDLAMLLHLRTISQSTEDSDNDGRGTVREAQQVLARHRRIAILAEYIEARDHAHHRDNDAYLLTKRSVRYWQQAIYIFALYGSRPRDYPVSQISLEGHYNGWRGMIYYADEPLYMFLREDIVLELKKPQDVRKVSDLRIWLAGLGGGFAENVRRWKVLGDLYGVWEGPLALQIIRRCNLGPRSTPEQQEEYVAFMLGRRGKTLGILRELDS